MPPIVTIAEMKALEAAGDRAGVSYAQMMENAGRAVAESILAQCQLPTAHFAVVLCGAGNNGGDGLVAAHHLAAAGMPIALYTTKPPDDADPKIQRLRAQHIAITDCASDPHGQQLQRALARATVCVDAVLGTGARLPVQGAPANLLTRAAHGLAARQTPPLRVAVDCPSGLDCDTGAVDALTLPADLTITLVAAKPGQLTFPGADFVGDLRVADIGLPPALPELQAISLTLADDTVRRWLPARLRHAHKGTFGRALIVAGSLNYTGAAYLAAAAAYRIGAGLVAMACPAPLHAALAGQLPEAIWALLPNEAGALAASAAPLARAELAKAQAAAFGPGFGTHPATAQFVAQFLEDLDQAAPPLVVDADGLRLVARLDQWWRSLPRGSILTPHPGEMAVLTGLSNDELQANRIGAARKFAAAWGVVVVLKGAFSVIAAPDQRATVLPIATSALARAGTGDVLTGTIAGLLAQGAPSYEAAVLGAYVHGRAGLHAAAAQGHTTSVLASDVLHAIPDVLKALQN